MLKETATTPATTSKQAASLERLYVICWHQESTISCFTSRHWYYSLHPPKNRSGRTSTVKARKEYQVKSIPPNAMTCIQVKALLKKSNCLSKGITICSQCGHFELDRHSIKRLRQIEDNNPWTVGVSIPKHFQCQTWWVTESKNTTAIPSSTCPPSPLSSSLPMEPSHTPPILSTGHSTKSPLQEDLRLRRTANYCCST
jgi:hypothetical protein